jgi:uncharacterized protein (TIGR03435 family)
MRSVANLAISAVLAVHMLAQEPSPSTAQITPEPPKGSVVRNPEAQTKFEAADVHFTPPYRVPFYSGAFLTGDRFIIRQATMTHLVYTAYNLKQGGYVGGGPSWIHWDRYDIMAKVPADTTLETARVMLQNLLAERFKLVAHPGDVQVPAYLLTLSNNKANLKLSTAKEVGSCKPKYPNGPVSPGSIPTFGLECHAVSLDTLADSIGSVDARDYIPYATPVINTTGLKGLYDLDLKWTPKWFLTQAGSAGVTLAQALETLGLELDYKTTPQPGIVIDSVNREPTPNPPDLAKIMPPLPPPQFEVATVKPSDPAEQRWGRSTGDEIDFRGFPLKFFISIAWDLDQSNDDTLVAPKWLDSTRFDLHAKVAASDLGNSTMGRSNSMNFDDLRPMLRSLLVDRFEIKYHMEERPIDAYTLMAVDPKLTKADPKEYTGCGTNPGSDGKDPRLNNPALDSIQTCVNTTMGQFAGQLHRIAPDYFFYPVIDATGLTGAWDFTFVWSSAHLTQNGGPGPVQASSSDSTPAASDPNGAVSFFDAIRKQLGLKVIKQKQPEPVLVIDKINEKPTEN